MERIVQRCAGLDVHKASITACVRTPGEAGGLHQEGSTRRSESSPLPPEGFCSCGIGSPLSELRWWAWRPRASTGSRSTTCSKTTSSRGFLTPAISRTSPAGRPIFRTRRGSASWWSTGSGASQLRAAQRDKGTERSHPLPQGSRIEERTREVQRLEKVLQDAGIKLSSVATRALGVSGRAFAQLRSLAAPPIPRYRRSWLGGSYARRSRL